jgi:hypothetical protein
MKEIIFKNKNLLKVKKQNKKFLLLYLLIKNKYFINIDNNISRHDIINF